MPDNQDVGTDMPREKILCSGRLVGQVGATRALKIAGGIPWSGNHVQDIVVMVTDLIEFRDIMPVDFQSGQKLLIRTFQMVREKVLEFGGIFERTRGDRTYSCFSSKPMLPNDETDFSAEQPSVAASRAIACSLRIQEAYGALVDDLPAGVRHQAPKIRVGIAANLDSTRSFALNVFGNMPILPIEFCAISYQPEADAELANNDDAAEHNRLVSTHLLADALCGKTVDRKLLNELRIQLVDNKDQEQRDRGHELWDRATIRPRHAELVLVDITKWSRDDFRTVEEGLAKIDARYFLDKLPAKFSAGKAFGREVAIASIRS